MVDSCEIQESTQQGLGQHGESKATNNQEQEGAYAA